MSHHTNKEKLGYCFSIFYLLNLYYPSSHKKAVGCTLFSRTSTHSSSLVQLAEEESHIYEALKRNGYLKKFIRRCKNQITARKRRPSLSVSNVFDQDKTTRVTIPYIQSQSEAIRRILSPIGILTVFRPLTTLRKLLSKPKDKIPTLTKSGVVYEIPCQ